MKHMGINTLLATLVVAGLGLALPSKGEIILIDFGDDSSWRGLSVAGGVDENGNSWNSVWSGAYYTDLTAADGGATAVDFGFGTAAGGTDSYNGPAGDTSAGAAASVGNTAFNPGALGLLGATNAVFDYYNDTTFTIQGLDATKTYNLTFFGSHKYDIPGTSTYTLFSSNDYVTAVASTTLAHNQASTTGWEWEHNQDQVATINGVSPQFADSLWIKVDGYINAMQIEVVPEPATFALFGLVGGGMLIARRRLKG